MEKKYYVYAYLDPRSNGDYKFGSYTFKNKPFYIGKGKDGSGRLDKHLKSVKEQNKDLTNNTYKLNVINQILNEGLEPIIIKIIDGLDEKTAYTIEALLINIMGFRYNNTGILTNISIGGFGGGDTFTNNPNKEEIREKHRINAIGVNNPMYGLKLEDRPSHKAKIIGKHWNIGRKASEQTKLKMSENNRLNNPNAKCVVKLDLNGNDIEAYSSSIEAAIKNGIKHNSGITRAIKQGSTAGGFKWRFKFSELVIPKPKENKGRVFKNYKKVFYKTNIEDEIEIIFDNIESASKHFNICKEVIRRKCVCNNTEKDVFRYENGEYKFKIKNGVKIKVKMIEENGVETIFNSVSDAVKHINGVHRYIVDVCEGRKIKYKNVKFKYV